MIPGAGYILQPSALETTINSFCVADKNGQGLYLDFLSIF